MSRSGKEAKSINDLLNVNNVIVSTLKAIHDYSDIITTCTWA